MSRRSRRRTRAVAGQGGPDIWPSAKALPLTHESVRRLRAEDLFDTARDYAARVPRVLVAHALPALRRRSLFLSASPRPRALRRRADLLLLRSLRVRLPKRVAFCVRRKRRREVLHALGVAGSRGVGAGKRWRRSESSNWRC